MHERTIRPIWAALLCGLWAIPGIAWAGPDDRRPNILWLSCEDLSPHHVGCYGGKGAITPNVDALAARGVRYTRAFTNAGVCAPSRTGIITGMMPTTLGANHMRSKARVPGFVRGFPAYLREAGYYCSNNVKTDYNLAGFEAGWHEVSNKAHWRNRPDRSQPFFAVFNWVGTHESQVFADAEQHEKLVKRLKPRDRQDPDKLDVPPIYPDTPVIRRDQADYHELATVMDLAVGDRLKELADDGLLDNTIVFFWSDHGDGLPRAKRWLYDSGTLIPLVVAIPEALRHPGQGKPGTTDDRLISGLDLGPTVLNLAGVPTPPHMQGRPFLGPGLGESRAYVYGARDRMDERYDLIRSVRDRRYLYIRNLTPWKPYNQPVEYGEQQASMQELRRLAMAGELPENCRWFQDGPKPAEELYDTEDDPWQVHNRIDDPALRSVAERLRREYRDWTLRTRDVHLLPEPMLADVEAKLGTRFEVFRNRPERLERILSVTLGETPPAPSDAAEAVRYWSAQRLGFGGKLGELPPFLDDPSPSVRLAAADWLAKGGDTARAMPVIEAALSHQDPWVVVAALTVIDELGSAAGSSRDALRRVAHPEEEYAARLLTSIRRKLGP
ncbi:MAG: sulfatase-like hydrolase/transferase [Isosphaeraceae bacterium]